MGGGAGVPSTAVPVLHDDLDRHRDTDRTPGCWPALHRGGVSPDLCPAGLVLHLLIFPSFPAVPPEHAPKNPLKTPCCIAPFRVQVFSLLLLPVTIIERQYATLVTKMTPRFQRSRRRRCHQLPSPLPTTRSRHQLTRDTVAYGCRFQRSHVLRLGVALAESLRLALPDLPRPTRDRMHSIPICNLTYLEMYCGFVQFVAACVVVFYSSLLLFGGPMQPGGGSAAAGISWAEEEALEETNGLVSRYFDAGDGLCEFGWGDNHCRPHSHSTTAPSFLFCLATKALGAGGQIRGLALLLCTRDDYGEAGPFSVERLKMDLPFVNLSRVQTSTQRTAGPLGGGRGRQI